MRSKLVSMTAAGVNYCTQTFKSFDFKISIFGLGYDLSLRFFYIDASYCANLKAIRYESTSLNRIVADKSHHIIIVLQLIKWCI